jgi:hypothetical protein
LTEKKSKHATKTKTKNELKNRRTTQQQQKKKKEEEGGERTLNKTSRRVWKRPDKLSELAEVAMAFDGRLTRR